MPTLHRARERINTRKPTNASLPDISGLPLFDFYTARTFNSSDPDGLTAGGRIIYRRTRRPVSTCNAIAALVGIGMEVDHA